MSAHGFDAPVLVLSCKLTGLAIMRSLGRLGVPVHGVDFSEKSAGLMSRYCKGKFIKTLDEQNPGDYFDFIMSIGERLGERTILIPTSDELAVFVADHADRLSRRFVFPMNEPDLLRNLISKKGMFDLARRHGFPTPMTLFPESLEEVVAYSRTVTYPVMLKGIHGNRLFARTGKKMVIVQTPEALIGNYEVLEDPGAPNLMLQEYIPGGDDTIFIFNGYFDDRSECLAAFTGHKIRQYPIHVGCASLGVCTWNQKVADLTTAFMKAIGYKGILDIGYRYDARDGSYKVLDINPRIGQAFRLFVARDGTDVVRTLYRDLTGRRVPHAVPREGRRWVIEDYDIESSIDYFREGSLTVGQYLRSFRGLEEGAWFDWKDPYPFLQMLGGMVRRAFGKIGKTRNDPGRIPSSGQSKPHSLPSSVKKAAKSLVRAAAPLSLRKRLAVFLNGRVSLGQETRQWWTMELLRDFAEKDPNEFHRFLWSHHLAYASTYTVAARFGKNGLDRSRQLFFGDLRAHLSAIGVDSRTDVRSVLEVGCSLGYQLRFLETNLFPSATELRGIDIDRYAIREGMDHLRKIESKVVLACDDMGNFDRATGNGTFDVLIATGVLMYLEEKEALGVVQAMMRRCGKMVALSGLAHPDTDNSRLARSEVRKSDGSFIHNLDVMVERSGGKVLTRRWEGNRLLDGHSIYFVFALPGASARETDGGLCPSGS